MFMPKLVLTNPLQSLGILTERQKSVHSGPFGGFGYQTIAGESPFQLSLVAQNDWYNVIDPSGMEIEINSDGRGWAVSGLANEGKLNVIEYEWM